MVREVLLDSNQHKKWYCKAETSAEVYRYKIHSTLDNTSPHLAWYGKVPASMNSEPLDLIYTPSPHIIKS